MKNTKLLFLSSLLLLAPLASCGTVLKDTANEVNVNDAMVEKVEFDVNFMTLSIGDSFTLNPIITYVGDTPVAAGVLWRSSNTRVATINNGFVTAMGGGTCVITLMVGYKSAACTIYVPKPDSPVDPVDPEIPEDPDEFTIRLNASSHTMTIGEEYLLVATTSEPADVTYTTNSSIIRVDNSGRVIADADGTAIVTASANGKVATCTITVIPNGGGGPGDEDEEMNAWVVFFINYNLADEDDTTGTRMLASFKWYQTRPIAESGKVPATPTVAPTDDFPYFIGWSDHSIIDTKDDLIDLSTYCVGTTNDFVFIYGIWADVPQGEFNK